MTLFELQFIKDTLFVSLYTLSAMCDAKWCMSRTLRWFDTVFSGLYLAFSIGVYQPSLELIDVKITPVVGKGLKSS